MAKSSLWQDLNPYVSTGGPEFLFPAGTAGYLHVSLDTQDPEDLSYQSNLMVVSSFARPRMFLTVPGRFHQTEIERGVLQIPEYLQHVHSGQYGQSSKAHFEFYDHNSQLVLEFFAEVMEKPQSYDGGTTQWFHGTECLCPNRDTLF